MRPEPGLIIAQGRYITETVAAMLPLEPAYKEEGRTWDTQQRANQKKLKAWIINPAERQIVSEERDANYAE